MSPLRDETRRDERRGDRGIARSVRMSREPPALPKRLWPHPPAAGRSSARSLPTARTRTRAQRELALRGCRVFARDYISADAASADGDEADDVTNSTPIEVAPFGLSRRCVCLAGYSVCGGEAQS